MVLTFYESGVDKVLNSVDAKIIKMHFKFYTKWTSEEDKAN